jgi:hypothetical protein
MLAALATTALFAADGAYRWYRHASATVTALQTPERSVETAEPAPVEAQPAAPAPQAPVEKPAAEPVRIEAQLEDRTGSGSHPRPADDPIANLATGPHPSLAGAPVPDLARGPAPRPDSSFVPEEIAPQNKPPRLSQQPKRQQAKRQPAKQQAAPGRTKAQRAVQAAKPNVYWEQDSQLGFAPQLRKRTCNPATGHMPMQCYYPREGRERFPSKPLN